MGLKDLTKWTPTERDLDDTDQKLKWLGAIAGAIGTTFTALEHFSVVEPTGLGRYSLALAALLLALAVAILVRAWLRPPHTDGADKAKAFGLKAGAVLGFFVLLSAGAAPLLSLLCPTTNPILERRLVLGYEEIPGHPDSLAVSILGHADPSKSLVMVVANVTVADSATSCGDTVFARWGIAPPDQGQIEYHGRASIVGGAYRGICLLAQTQEQGQPRTLTHLIIPARHDPRKAPTVQ
jgi:hypothetical protein